MSVQESYGGDADPAHEYSSDFNPRPQERPNQEPEQIRGERCR